jgi:putative oxidoreductase
MTDWRTSLIGQSDRGIGAAAQVILRVVVGLAFIHHGTSKLFGFPPFPMPGPLPLLGVIAGLLELIGGSLVLVGFLTRPVAFLLSGQMAVAYWVYHAPASFFPSVNGGEAAMLYCFIFLYFAGAGAGALSVDARLFGEHRKSRS